MDHFRYSSDFVASGNDQWLRDWRIHPYSLSDRHRRGANPNHPGAKTLVVVSIDSSEKRE